MAESHEGAAKESDSAKPPETFSSWLRQRIWMRWGAKGMVAFWALTGVAGAAYFVFQEWDKPVLQAIRKAFEGPRTLKLQPDPLSIERAKELGFAKTYGIEGRTEYALLVDLTASFADDRFNDAPPSEVFRISNS